MLLLVLLVLGPPLILLGAPCNASPNNRVMLAAPVTPAIAVKRLRAKNMPACRWSNAMVAAQLTDIDRQQERHAWQGRVQLEVHPCEITT